MRIALLSPGEAAPAEAAAVVRHAALLGARHEVEVVVPGDDVEGLVFAGPEHVRSAAAMEAIRERYREAAPDYLEVRDSSALGLVPLQARASGDPVLAGTAVGVRVAPSAELRSLHNSVLSQPDKLLAAQLGRDQLRRADFLLWPGGDCLELYRRYYGELGIELPEPLRSRPAPAPLVARAGSSAAGDPEGPLRILFLGALERRRGALDLLEACLSLPVDDWELTLAGPDTETATMGQSVAFTIEAMCGDDPRVRLRDGFAEPPDGGLAGFDLLAVPARTEAWSEEAEAALAAGIPVLATPVGGLVEQVEDGVNGWLADGIGPESLRRSLLALLADRAAVARLRVALGEDSSTVDPEPILAAYDELATRVGRRPATPIRIAEPPLVTGIVPYYQAHRFVAEAVESLLAQTHSPLEVLVVNDGSFAADDEVLDQLAARPRVSVVTQVNAGEAAARNLGAILARGKYLMMLDADNVLEPTFVERAVTACERDPGLSYVTCWLRMVDEEGVAFDPPYGYAALGNAVVEHEERNWDGDALALLPRRLFAELGYCYGPEGSMHADWELYRWLHRDGRYGTVIPERLARYRILPQSLLRAHSEELQEYGWNEARDRNRQRGMRWTANRS